MSSSISNKTLEILKRYEGFCKAINQKVFFITFGGWAVDGHIGRITRDHLDIDCICFREDVVKIENILSKLGYPAEIFSLPNELDFKYKIRTNDKDQTFTFQIADKLSKDTFEISFYRFSHLKFPTNYLEKTEVNLNGVRYTVVKKEFLINLKKREIEFYRNEKKNNPEKYNIKHKQKHLNCENDYNLLIAITK